MTAITARDGIEIYDKNWGEGPVATSSHGWPVRHLRWTADQLAEQAARLARRNEALEDFAALVAHDIRSSLVSALLDDAPREGLKRALELVDSILEAVRAERAGGGVAAVADCVRQAVADLGDTPAEVITSVTGDFPMPPAALRLVLRNLLANAVAAGAHSIHVSALASEIGAPSSSMTTALGSGRPTATPPALGLASPCAIGSLPGSEAGSSSNRELPGGRAP